MWLFDKLIPQKKAQEAEKARSEAEREAAIRKELKEAQQKALEEMLVQGFAKHRAQMCMIINKPALRSKNEPSLLETAAECAKQSAILADRLDDNNTLELFSDTAGKPHIINISNRDDDIKITESIETQTAPTLTQHFKSVVKHYYPDGPTEESRNQTVFCTMVTAGIDDQQYEEIKDSLDTFYGMPFFLKIIDLASEITSKEKAAFDKLDDYAAEKIFDNVDVIHVKEPKELTYKKLLNEYKGFVAQAYTRKILTGDPGFDAKAVDMNAEGRVRGGL